MYRMTAGSILIMCLLIFALSGHDRLPLVTGPKARPLPAANEHVHALESFRETDVLLVHGRKETSDAPVVVAQGAWEDALDPPPAPRASAAAAALREIACAASFPVVLPAESSSYALLEWSAAAGQSVTLRFQFADGGMAELTQKLDAELLQQSRKEEPQEERPCGSLDAPSASLPDAFFCGMPGAVEMIWRDGIRVYELHACGLSDEALYDWLHSLSIAQLC